MHFCAVLCRKQNLGVSESDIVCSQPGAYLGPCPPFVTWAEGLSTETVGEDIFLKSGLNLSEDLFFCSSPNFGPETT